MLSLPASFSHAYFRPLAEREMEPVLGDKKDPESVGNIVLPIFAAIQNEFPGSSRRMTGSYFTNQIIAPIHPIVHDLDVKLVFVDPSPDRHVLFDRIKCVIEPILSELSKQFKMTQTSLQYTKNYSYGFVIIQREGALPIEISINILNNPDVRLHLMNIDSYYAEESNLTSGAFNLCSKEGDLEDIKNKVITSKISPELLDQLDSSQWARYIIFITDGCIERGTTTNSYFFEGALRCSKADLFPNLMHRVQRKRKEIPNYLYAASCNALFSSFPVESFEQKKMKNKFIEGFKELFQNAEKSWPAFFHKGFEGLIKEDQIVSFLTLFIPMFSEKVEIKKHLYKVHAICQFKEGDYTFYISVPLFSREESDLHPSLSSKENLSFPIQLSGDLSFVPLLRAALRGDLCSTEEELKEKQVQSKVKEAAALNHFSLAVSEMLKSNHLISDEIKMLLPFCNYEFFSEEEAFSLLSKGLNFFIQHEWKEEAFPFLFKGMERLTSNSKLLCDGMRIVLLHKDLIECYSDAWKDLSSLIERGAQDTKPWKALFIRCIQETDLEKNEKRSAFLKVFSQKVGPLRLEEFPKLLPDETSKWLYHLRSAILLRDADPDLSFERMSSVLEEGKLDENIVQLQTFPLAVEDPFNFSASLEKLSKEGEWSKKWHLLAYQGALRGFIKILPLCSETLLQSKRLKHKKEERDACSLDILKRALDETSKGGLDPEETEGELAWSLYKDFYHNPLAAELIESKYLKPFKAASLVRKLSEIDQKKYVAILIDRIEKTPSSNVRNLAYFLRVLGKQGDAFLPLFAQLTKKDVETSSWILEDFPELIEPMLEKVQSQKDQKEAHFLGLKFYQQGSEVARKKGLEYFTQKLDEVIQKFSKEEVLTLARGYLQNASEKEKATFAFTLFKKSAMFNPFLKDLFFASIGSDVIGSEELSLFDWSKEQIQNGLYLMKLKLEEGGRSKLQIEEFVEATIKDLSHRPEHRTLLQELSPYLNEQSRKIFAEQAQKEIERLLSKPNEISLYSSFLQKPSFVSILLENEELYSAFLSLLLKQPSMTKQEKASLVKFFELPLNFPCPVSGIFQGEFKEENFAYRFFLERAHFNALLFRNKRLYEVFMEVVSKHVSLKKSTESEKVFFLQLIDQPIPFSAPLQQLELTLLCLEGLNKKLQVSFAPLIVDKWVATVSLPSFLDLSKRMQLNFPELSSLFLLQVFPRLNKELDEETLLQVLDHHLLFLSDPESVYGFADYVLEMQVRFPTSKALIECSKKLVHLALKWEDQDAILDLIGGVHKPRLEQAIEAKDDKTLLDELILYWEGKDALFSFIHTQFHMGMSYLSQRLEDPAFLSFFQEKEVTSLKVSLFVCYLFRKCIHTQVQKESLLKHLSFHLKNIESLQLDLDDYKMLEELSEGLLKTVQSLTEYAQNIKEIDFEWIPNKDLAECSKTLIGLFLKKGDSSGLERALLMIQRVHMRRLYYSDIEVEDSVFLDLEAYCLYWERIDLQSGLEMEIIPTNYMLAIFNRCFSLDATRASAIANRLFRAMIDACKRSDSNSKGFSLALNSLELIFNEKFYGIRVDPEEVFYLIYFAYRAPWNQFIFYSYLNLLMIASKMPYRSALYPINSEFIQAVLEKAVDEVKKIKEISAPVDLHAVKYLAQMICGSCPFYCPATDCKVPKELFSSLIVEIKRLIPGSISLILENLAAKYPKVREDYLLASSSK